MTANKGKSIPNQVLNFDKIKSEETKPIDPKNLPAKLLDRLPKPTGWRILVLPYQGTGKTKGGILLADETVEMHQVATVCGYVLRMGPDAYKDSDKFPNGAYCSEKQWVLMGRYAGNRFKVDGLELRIINDDNIIATILDPADISYV